MADVFLSYRRSDAPQACRVHDWLALRLGEDALFMDVRAIPLAVEYPDFIRTAIHQSHVLLALVGADWTKRIHAPDDPVRMEVETALAAHVPVLPVLIGSTRMPGPEDLPSSLASFAALNAAFVGVFHDFDTHMRGLLPRVESFCGVAPDRRLIAADSALIELACEEIVTDLRQDAFALGLGFQCQVYGPEDVYRAGQNTLSLQLHRIAQRRDALDLHVLLSFWAQNVGAAHHEAGRVISRFDREPTVPRSPYSRLPLGVQLKVRRSEEDPRQIWKMITDMPLRLSLAYIVSISMATPTAGDHG